METLCVFQAIIKRINQTSHGNCVHDESNNSPSLILGVPKISEKITRVIPLVHIRQAGIDVSKIFNGFQTDLFSLLLIYCS